MAALSSPSLGVFLDTNEILAKNGFSTSSTKKLSSCPFVVACSSSSSSSSSAGSYIPKAKPFNSSHSLLDKALKDPPLIQKTENWIADYCTTLEGDECYSCWTAYHELKELEEEVPREDVERMIVHAGGMKSLIKRVHQVSSNHKAAKEELAMKSAKLSKGGEEVNGTRKTKKVPDHVPDGIPMPGEEMEDMADMMSDSPHMNLLRAMHIYPSWYSPARGNCMD